MAEDVSEKKKVVYHPENWATYNRSLKQRGALTLWVDAAVVHSWYVPIPEVRGRGRTMQYTDGAIQTALTFRALYRLPLRAVEGFLTSLFHLLKVPLRCPDYTLLSKRGKTVQVKIPRFKTDEPQHIVIDSTGLKVYGEGEWKVRQHGFSKRRTWRKLHLSINEKTQQITATELTENDVHDSEVMETLVDNTPGDIDQISADGAYDKTRPYQVAHGRGARLITPPQKNAEPRLPAVS